MAIPVWRVVKDGQNGGDWTLVEGGLVNPPTETASAEAAFQSDCMWNAEIRSLIFKEFSCTESNQFRCDDEGRTDCLLIGKENFQQKLMGMGSSTKRDANKHSQGFSPRKRGILTENSVLCNVSEVAVKRQRLSLTPQKMHDDVQPMFQTASLKPVHISRAAIQKARALLGFDDLGQEITHGKKECSSSIASLNVAKGVGEIPKDYNGQLKDSAAAEAYEEELCPPSKGPCKEINAEGKVPIYAENHTTPAIGYTKRAVVCGSPVLTASGKSASINLNNLNICTSAADNTLVECDLDENSNASMVCLTQKPLISFPKPPSSPLQSKDLFFPCDVHRFSTTDGHVEKPTSDASSCLFQTATGKAVSISTSGMLQARKLFANTEISNLDKDPPLKMFQTAQGKSVSVSSSAMKKAANLLGGENVIFPAEGPLSSPPIRFVTAVGKSISVSSSAMKRAKDLLGGDGDLEKTEIRAPTSLVNRGRPDKQQLFETSKGHIIRVSSDSIERAKLLLKEGTLHTGISNCTPRHQNLDFSYGKNANIREPPTSTALKTWPNHNMQESSLTSGIKKGALPRKWIASFKAPRQLQTPAHPTSSSHSKEHIQTVRHGFSELLDLHSRHKKGRSRISLKEFFKEQPQQESDSRHLTNEVRMMTSETAKTYRLNSPRAGMESVGSDEFRSMLLEAGANSQVVNKEWVDNHYRWVVWKLASLERSYPSKVANKLLTVQKVFDELKYRYEREVDGAHRSAIKKISEGDSVASRMMILCVAAVRSTEDMANNLLEERKTLSAGDLQAAHVEVTDGWYSLIAHLDPALSRQLKSGKVFVGQKLRVCGATLLGCTTPIPPLEAFQVMKLGLHINGTFRARWMDKLGFCRGLPMPSAFHCIKPGGGLVPRTIIGIHRIYPILYFERLPNRGSITRSARAEDLAARGYHDRRMQVAEDAIIKMEKECVPGVLDNEMDEGAKIFKLLESSAEPELLMAEMSAEQHAAFAAFQTKKEAARHSLAQKNILKALGEVYLDAREVTPFVKISVTGLCFLGTETALKNKIPGKITKGGLVTIWHATEEQVDGLKEGGVYCVSNLNPLTGKGYTHIKNAVLHLCTTKLSDWQLLPQAMFPSFSPRKALSLSMLGTLPFRSEFDVAVLIIHVGKPYTCGSHQRQWLFASDGSWEEQYSKESKKLISLLAIDLSASSDAFLPVERALEGSVIGYCNLVKRCRDQRNSMWVAESSETSVFSSSLSGRNVWHLKTAADHVKTWAKSSERLIAELEERVHKAVAGGN